MAVGAFLEPAVVVSLLFGGAFFNRNKDYHFFNPSANLRPSPASHSHKRSDDLHISVADKRISSESLDSSADDYISSPRNTTAATTTFLSPNQQHSPSRRRRIHFLRYSTTLHTPNTLVFKDRLLSRVLQKFPFLVEAWYWALIYWVYQLGRAFTALTLVEGTVHVARKHALQVIHLEQALHMFIEVPFQQWFLARPALLHWINRIYSFIHIPGTIFFLVVLYYLTTTRKRRVLSGRIGHDNISAGPALYEARRRTMAVCNLLAFVVFTLWPCMPPRLLSDPNYKGPDAAEAKSFGFVDTVHSSTGESSVWTTNKFCNQYAAMPSLHFGYSLLIGLTVATLPINGVRSTSWKRIAIVLAGLSYPALILTAIVATANHFVLDAVAGAMVCGLAWNFNGVLLNLLVVEDYFLWLVRIHKPVNYTDPEFAAESEHATGLLSDV